MLQPITIPGLLITGTDTDGIVLSDPATDDPATVAATGYITNQTATHDYDAIYGAPGYSWTVANLGTIGQLGLYGAGIHLTGGGFVTNGESGSNTGWITGNVPVYIQGGSSANASPTAQKAAPAFTWRLAAASSTARADRQEV